MQFSERMHVANGEAVDSMEVTVVPPTTINTTPSFKAKSIVWLGSLVLTGLFITIICIVLLRSGENDIADGVDMAVVDRQGYYTYLLETYDPFPSTPQDQAITWLAFQDEPLSGKDLEDRLNQRYALVVLYYAHGGAFSWNSINDDPGSGWINSGGVGVHECDWKGVDCSNNGTSRQITGLRLSAEQGIKLTGSQLSTEIGFLTNLQSLYMADQGIQASIPSDWRTLTNLMILDLSNNEIRSTIPDFLGDFTSLQAVLLGGNLLSGSIPASLDDSNIERLELQHNSGMEGRIEVLLTSMPKLSYLDVSSTSVSGFLPSTEVQALQELHAWGSRITGTIPSEISTWSNLGQSRIIGTIPSEAGLLPNLEAINLSSLSMNGTLPTELSLLETLSSLELRVSSFIGTLPTEYAQLNDLVVLDIAYNGGMHGPVPREYQNMKSLKNLYLHGTRLSGTVDPGMCSLHLTHFTADCIERGEVELNCNCCTECFNLP
ncbi:unnamed protein product [Cylindrotheca closterium]|uniref:Leucine-rich repeat-containing N-terminal plant-type domain-containing protein n=1 Tax=Cylindrotheca closterium TaxID=2856 RepID=A0AAD2CY28_9STRA|nr:unnamed protein product [Cylindrotheca closterium]